METRKKTLERKLKENIEAKQVERGRNFEGRRGVEKRGEEGRKWRQWGKMREGERTIERN